MLLNNTEKPLLSVLICLGSQQPSEVSGKITSLGLAGRGFVLNLKVVGLP